MWRVYSVFDTKAQEYGQLILARTDEVARRMFADAVREPGSLLHLHPEDFGLCHIGYFDEMSGGIAEAPVENGVGVSYEPDVVVTGAEVAKALQLVNNAPA